MPKKPKQAKKTQKNNLFYLLIWQRLDKIEPLFYYLSGALYGYLRIKGSLSKVWVIYSLAEYISQVIIKVWSAFSKAWPKFLNYYTKPWAKQ